MAGVGEKQQVKSTMGDDTETERERGIEWSHLPPELLPIIARHLQNRIDLVRFGSVCKSWRSSIPPFHPNSPSFPIKLSSYIIPCPYGNLIDHFILTQTTFYRIHPPNNTHPSSSSSNGWLVQVEESESLPMRLFNPLTNRRMTDPPRLWDLLHCGVVELCKSYTIQIQRTREPQSAVDKLVFFPNSCWASVEDSVVCGICQEGKLEFMRYGDKSWTLLDDRNFHYDDVIVYKGQFYVVDRWGIISWIDISSQKLIQYSPPLHGCGGKKDLVESCGGLYVVERYYEGDARRGTRRMGPDHDAQVVDFKVYKLDEEWGSWVDVKSLDDRAFVLGDKCSFSLSAKEFAGFHWNCIYFFDFNDIRMYNLRDGGIVKVGRYPSSSNLFWPPPSWLRV